MTHLTDSPDSPVDLSTPGARAAMRRAFAEGWQGGHSTGYHEARAQAPAGRGWAFLAGAAWGAFGALVLLAARVVFA